jgi:hypothetical protein
MRQYNFLWVCFFVLVSGSLLAQDRSESEIDFNTQIRPILSNNCYACHGPDEAARAADLRLDTYDGATDFAIDTDDPAESELLLRVASTDNSEVMPPPKHGKPLTTEEQQLLLEWIQQGAKYAKHWSYEKPTKSEVPSPVNNSVVNPIDNFILKRLKRDGMQFSAAADRLTIIRRLALDLTGLPPTPEQVDLFVSDQSANAYEKLVDHYLAQPAYGERWASVWLDLARYADSAGFAEDKMRTIWAYRDYVIRSYNANKPFDQFTIEQLAGDLIDNATEETRIATAFHRNTLTNSEGGTSDEEFRSAAVVDRVNTTMAVWMGTTMACAQCHTHKYDPITQAEYFQFYDFFNHTEDNDRANEAPFLSLYAPETLEKRKQIEAEIALLNKVDSTPSDAELDNWKSMIRDSDGQPIRGRYVRVELTGNDRILSLAEVQVFSSTPEAKNQNVAKAGTATQSSTAFGGPPKFANDGKTDGDFEAKSVTHTATEKDPWWQVDLGSELPIEKISIWQREGLHQRSDGFRLTVLDQQSKAVWSRAYSKASAEEQAIQLQSAPDEIREIVLVENPAEAQDRALIDFYQRLHRSTAENELAKLQNQLNQLRAVTTVPVMVELAENKKRTTQIQIRGSYLNTGATVTAKTPEVLHPIPEDIKSDRRAIANWLVDQNNPLTARVLVNRYWEQIFGVGIVKTSEEFGAQGDLPSHPELLDWLAVDLMENDWDTRRLLKQIVMSRTYRQSSKATTAALETDPNNRLLSRGPRVRLSAEMIRDQALAVSGLLSSKMFGPPVHPPQPKVGLKPAFSGKTTDWTDSVGEDRYRRGIYTEWRRSSPYPSMATFDVNSREVCEIKRTNTNTPLQALVTLNDPVYVEAAKSLARRVAVGQEANDPREIAERAFRFCLIRKPKMVELDRIVQLFEKAKLHFAKDPDAAKELATDPLHPLGDNVDLVEIAAWTTVANVLLNLDEMLMKP